ncbi:MAG: undecaprenyl-phosphate glucose phosphotransferase [Omnitrophica bacterium RIFCSPLOWO2_12_FULL_44_17]|uniref:Undecaprenyl-phosphate glucose phosphotransferase n=1 Tax=Candidatus Danuiimicrobium aquiferis TaxID=1801832 RepID=A0A1G1KYL9_9BACT|nr:MAG: undecaprenyl-phosphate glucose phosphotransferase [Omnitrophica bacterium RIFCSPHIGHO2_02_FULL_45_28]OGW88390.1 MAG: undecaprenyl-phosphate glucose phosphotransferase [Omnitrophica bacterium RIFCSPHIGHO2_12_FULL_44_12]OGW97953.1 MAG: undecaprenyl-phosphate glucose phosphotransferase [Omnitrophica bacterium RIFCSPLOWO2_12_FULL_44_17]OGX04216.1 MAG: undecaprenyl-phosphate glucose phosphotransferase [Omnitrophica bacterium RIFCSPLOWO2_02_FULL_44_11]
MLSPRKHPFFAFSVITSDIIGILAGYFVAYWFRFSGIIVPIQKGIPAFHVYYHTVAIIIPFYLIIFRSYRLYQPERHYRRIYELLTVVKAVTAGTILAMALTFIYREFSYSRVVLFFAWFFTSLFCCIDRYFLIQIEYFIRKNRDRHRVLILGMNRSARDLIKWAKENPHYGQDIVGVVGFNIEHEGKHFEEIPILGSYTDFDQILVKEKIDGVIIADPQISREMATEIMLKCENKMIRFKLVADFYGLVTHYVDVEYVSNVPLLGLKTLPLDDPWNRLVKRSFDFVVSLGLLLLFSPLLLILSALIKLTSKGPIIYKQTRVGQDEKNFKLYKFRTMEINAEQITGPVWTKPDDPRTTTIGHFLRKTNIDELPQLWNVLKGNMSLVGPRPERPHFVEQFRHQVPRYMARHNVKTGITGWAQIHGLRGNSSLEERIKYDLYYMENWTLMMDIEIILATFFAFKNAY